VSLHPECGSQFVGHRFDEQGRLDLGPVWLTGPDPLRQVEIPVDAPWQVAEEPLSVTATAFDDALGYAVPPHTSSKLSPASAGSNQAGATSDVTP